LTYAAHKHIFNPILLFGHASGVITIISLSMEVGFA
jgi:hypothetical protein